MGWVKKSEYHGERKLKTVEYTAWCEMIQRCYYQKHSCYHRYGGRGIYVCEKWRNSYPEFLKDMGRKPSKQYSLDRVDVNGNYEPSNCRWATAYEQQNNRANCRYILYNGDTKTLTEWCRYFDISRPLVQSRLKRRNYEFDSIIFQKNTKKCQLH